MNDPRGPADGAQLQQRGYEIVRTIGEGGFGVVKQAYSQKHRDHVAIKVIQTATKPVRYRCQQLPKELDLLGEVRHRNITATIEDFWIRQTLYIVMTLERGGDLFDYLSGVRGPDVMRSTEKREGFRQVCEAVQYLHGERIVHNDIKLENILRDANGNLKLTDFGLAEKLSRHSSDVTRNFSGSLGWASPEKMQGIPFPADSADIWSLGCLLHILITGSMPYDGKSPDLVKRQQRKEISFGQMILDEQFDACSLIDSILRPVLCERATMDDVVMSKWLRRTPYVERISETHSRIISPAPVHDVRWKPRIQRRAEVENDERATMVAASAAGRRVQPIRMYKSIRYLHLANNVKFFDEATQIENKEATKRR